jgi:hypothetical protein
MKLNITYDEKRCGYFVQGHGFDFFAYFTGDPNGAGFIECDSVQRQGDDYTAHLSIPLNGAKMLSPDLLETLIVKELFPLWGI